MKICLERTEFLHSDGRTDIPKVIGAFRNFAIASKKENFLRCKRFGKSVELETIRSAATQKNFHIYI
jgi:hypothetical protein